MERHRGVALVAIVASSVWCAGASDGCRPKEGGARPEPALTRSWSALPPEALERIWAAAQGTGAVIAAEPETEVVGSRAASKKTWTLADVLLKFFLYGFQPNWFPADVIRRTACGTDPRWSYFWHLASGDERDLHPWMDGAAAFAQLVGRRNHVLIGSGALDVSSCSEVYAGVPEGKPCLYGEVTPPEGFEAWFCGGRGSECYGRVKSAHTQAPPDLARPSVACVHGPWVLERAHDWRPEIHPAEVMWVRHADAHGYWTFALVPDDSGRFRKKKHFDTTPEPAEWKPWSSDRPVELWVAYSLPAGPAPVFDLSVKRLDARPRPAEQVTLKPPPVGTDFVTIPHSLSSVVSVAARSWAAAGGEIRGLLVLRSRTLQRRPEGHGDASARKERVRPDLARGAAAGARTDGGAEGATRADTRGGAASERGAAHVPDRATGHRQHARPVRPRESRRASGRGAGRQAQPGTQRQQGRPDPRVRHRPAVPCRMDDPAGECPRLGPSRSGHVRGCRPQPRPACAAVRRRFPRLPGVRRRDAAAGAVGPARRQRRGTCGLRGQADRAARRLGPPRVPVAAARIRERMGPGESGARRDRARVGGRAARGLEGGGVRAGCHPGLRERSCSPTPSRSSSPTPSGGGTRSPS